MSQLERRVNLICPKCGSSKKVPVSVELIKKKESGSTSVFVPPNTICEHEFYAYIDKNFHVRDYLLLEYTIQEDAQRSEKIKKDILKKGETYNVSMKNVLKFIEHKDLRSLFYACFMGSSIILIENEPTEERFGVLLNFLAKIFTEAVKSLTLMTPEYYLHYSETNENELKKNTVYNVSYKLSVQKPFGDSDSEPFEELVSILNGGPIQIQMILAKNFIDYMFRFSEEFNEMKDKKNDKIRKILKKKYPDQNEILTSSMIEILRKKNEFNK